MKAYKDMSKEHETMSVNEEAIEICQQVVYGHNHLILGSGAGSSIS